LDYADNFKSMRKGIDLVQAIAEADRCLLCLDAPCSAGCPADTRPAEFIRKLRFKNVTGAIRTVKENNILGGACGVLCPTHRLCEEKCSARFASDNRPEGADRPVQIGAIQRFLVEHSWDIGFKPVTAPMNRRPEKVAVVGSGPAGLSCAAELAKAGFGVTIFEARPEPGGVLRYGVVANRFDLDFLNHELEDVCSLGVEIKCNAPVSSPGQAEKLLEEGFQAVFLGPGMWDAAALTSSSPAIDGLFSSVDYLSALRDGRFDEMVRRAEGKTVAVIGGGSVAMDCIDSAAGIGARDVYLIYRRSFQQMPAEPDERNDAQEAGVHFLLLNQPVDYEVGADGRISGVKLMRTRLGAPDDSGRRRPETIPGSEWVLDADLVIEAIGNRAPADLQAAYPGVKVDDRGRIQADDDTGQTSVPGIFAGGDIVRGPALVVNAVQDGKTAARAIIQYCNQREA